MAFENYNHISPPSADVPELHDPKIPVKGISSLDDVDEDFSEDFETDDFTKELPAGIGFLDVVKKITSELLKSKLIAALAGKTQPEKVPEIIAQQGFAEKIAKKIMKKVSEQLGSNTGGWYEDTETGKRYYIKFYRNPDQARVEFVTNAIYKKLGIKAVESQLFEIDGRLAIASEEVPGAEGATKEEQIASVDVRSGFIADAFLANWDVIGLVFDNVVKDQNGSMYRIDNGGSLVFRAQGGDKVLDPNDIPELVNMLNPNYNAGQVFAGITEDEMRVQARDLAQKLKKSDIKRIVKESGLPEETQKQIIEALIGRLVFLKQKFNVHKTQLKEERIPVAIEKLRAQHEKIKDIHLRPRVGFLGDSYKIENQQVDVIDCEDLGEYLVTFKLTAEHHKKIVEKIVKNVVIPDSTIVYQPNKGGDYSETVSISDAWSIEMDGVVVKVANGRPQDGNNFKSPRVISLLGVIQIIVKKADITDNADLTRKIDKVMSELLEIPDGLEVPTSEAERAYKMARFKWHHKIPEGSELNDDQKKKVEVGLVRKEVFPGYFTFVEKDKSQEYKSGNPFAVYHELHGGYPSLPKIIKAGGLICTHERYKRGLIYEGCSSREDLQTGGADSVFTRISTTEGIKAKRSGYSGWEASVSFYTALLFDTSLLDRTDWYAYPEDKYGTIVENEFKHRESPGDIFAPGKDFNAGNEQMFRLGISMNDVVAIAVVDVKRALEVIDILKSNGITEINGRTLEEFIVITRTHDELIEASMAPMKKRRTLHYIMTNEPETYEMLKYPAVFEFLNNASKVATTAIRAQLELAKTNASENSMEFAILQGIREINRSIDTFGDEFSYKIYSRNDSNPIPERYKTLIQEQIQIVQNLFLEFLAFIPPTIKTGADGSGYGESYVLDTIRRLLDSARSILNSTENKFNSLAKSNE